MWTMLVPGLAHLRLGHAARALMAFLTSVGLFALGAWMVGDRVWYFQLFEPFAFLEPVLRYVPLQLLPESPNLGCCIVFSMVREAPVGDQAMWDWMRSIRLPVPGEHLGLLLMGSTGIINALWCADAHWLAQERPAVKPAPAMAAALSWLLPGSGHVAVGQKDKGILVGVAVIAMFALGLVLSYGHGVDRPLRSAWWIPQILFGGGTAFTSVVTAPMEEGAPSPFMDHGVAMCAVAGLMNLVVMIDAYTIAESKADEAPVDGGDV